MERRGVTGPIKTIFQYFEDTVDKKSNPTAIEQQEWLLLKNPFPTVAICAFYIFFCRVIGPRLMKNRKAFQLGNSLVVYNFAQMALNCWIFYEYLQTGWLRQCAGKVCEPDDQVMTQRLANASWWYFMSKFSEMLDTVSYLLRKQFYLVSSMHVVHHGLMPISVWAGMKFAPGSQSVLFALVNSFVHVVMYFYYMLTATGVKNRRVLSWKKYITCLQVLQFVIVMAHQLQYVFYEYNYSRGFLLWFAFHVMFLLLLFCDLYKRKMENSEKIKSSNGNTQRLKNAVLVAGKRDGRDLTMTRTRDLPREVSTSSPDNIRLTPLTEELPSHEKEE